MFHKVFRRFHVEDQLLKKDHYDDDISKIVKLKDVAKDFNKIYFKKFKVQIEL